MFRVAGRYTKGAEDTGYLLENLDGGAKERQLKCSKNKFLELVRNEEVKDFTIVDMDGEESLVGLKSDISTYPTLLIKGNLQVIERVLDEGKVIGYKVKNLSNGEESAISKEKAWELAFYGTLYGIKAYCKKEGNKLSKILITS